MSTKQTTDSTSTLNYDKGSKSLYDQLTKSGGGILSQYMNNPFNNGFFNLGQGMGQAAAQRQGATNMNALLQNMKVSGLTGNAGNAFQLAQMGKIGRSTSAMGAGATMQNVLSALNRQMTSAQMGLSFNPLLTGESGHTVQQTGGLGTWLPQLAGSAIGAGMGAMTGGASMAGKAGMSAMKGASSFMPAANVFGGGLNPGLQSSLFSQGFNVGAPNPLMFQ